LLLSKVSGRADTVSDIIAHRILPTTIEFMERDAYWLNGWVESAFHDAAAHLLVQLDGVQEAVDSDYEVVSNLCLKHGAQDGLVAQDRNTRDRLWEVRRKIIESLKLESPINHMEDVVVPRANIPDLLRGVKDLARQHSVRIVSFGHAGDGNVHVNVLKDDLSLDLWAATVPPVQEGIYRLALSLGGTITGEHGIGATRRKYLPMAIDSAQMEIQRQIRNVFDPNCILNPGKIFRGSYCRRGRVCS
jgi:glycolate oxidase